MNWTSNQVRMAYLCVSAVVRGRELQKHEVPQNLRAFYQVLDEEYRSTSAPGTQNSCEREELTIEEPIDSGTAAQILGCSTRWVRQIRTDLDGQWTGSQWVFDRQRVVDYAEGKRHGRRTST